MIQIVHSFPVGIGQTSWGEMNKARDRWAQTKPNDSRHILRAYLVSTPPTSVRMDGNNAIFTWELDGLKWHVTRLEA